jgi:hypothetical protein
MPKRKDIKKILIIGSGPIVIGQACAWLGRLFLLFVRARL